MPNSRLNHNLEGPIFRGLFVRQDSPDKNKHVSDQTRPGKVGKYKVGEVGEVGKVGEVGEEGEVGEVGETEVGEVG